MLYPVGFGKLSEAMFDVTCVEASPMTISILIDSNAWNFLFEREIDINCELPPDEFAIFITREVEVELNAIPDIGKDGHEKRLLKEYIRGSIAQNSVRTTATFGFAEANPTDGPATYAGFQGTFQSDSERAWYGREKIQKLIRGKSKKGSGLSGNQADASVAASSFQCLVLTCDKRGGPIAEAANTGGKIIFLSEAAMASQSLKQLLLQHV